MYLEKLSLTNFKNYSNFEQQLNNQINCITGNNGVGKTNLLDSIYYLSFCKSFFNPNDTQNIKFGEDFFAINGRFVRQNSNEEILCGFKKSQKKIIKRNGKAYTRFSEHIGQFPVIMVSPSDSNLIEAGSDERRKFTDIVISLYNTDYLHDLIRYNKVLAQRNALLKDFVARKYFNESMLSLWNEQLVIYGRKIHLIRTDFIARLKPVFQRNYDFVSEGCEQVDVVYQSQLNNSDLAELLSQNTDKDRALQYTSVGVHRDDLTFTLDNHSLRRIGSQGQQKTFVMALRFAEFEFIYQQKKIKPIMLFDDIFDKLDSKRVAQIIKLVADGYFGQIFITDTNPERLKDKLEPLSVSFNHIEIETNN